MGNQPRNPEGHSPRYWRKHPEAKKATAVGLPNARVPEKHPLFRFFTNGFVQGVAVFIALAVAFSGKLDIYGALAAIAVAGLIGAVGFYTHLPRVHAILWVVAWSIALIAFYRYLASKGDGGMQAQGHNSSQTAQEHPQPLVNSEPPAASELPPSLTDRDIQRVVDALARRFPNIGPQVPAPPPAAQIIPGYLQLDKREFIGQYSSLEAGRDLRENLHFVNRGMTPVTDVHLWMMMTYIDVAANGPNVDSKMRRLWKKAVDDAYRKWKNKGGNIVGAGQEVWDTAVSYPLSEDQLRGLRTGDGRLYVLATAFWINSNKKSDNWPTCEWTSNLSEPNGIQSAIWHFCAI